MHHCLLVPELAARIVEACAQDYRVACLESGYRPHFNTLCALARTCRTLQEPALDVIWYYQFGIQNLVKCMPRTLYQIHRRPDPDESGMYNELVTVHYVISSVTLFAYLTFRVSICRETLRKSIGSVLISTHGACTGWNALNTTSGAFSCQGHDTMRRQTHL